MTVPVCVPVRLTWRAYLDRYVLVRGPALGALTRRAGVADASPGMWGGVCVPGSSRCKCRTRTRQSGKGAASCACAVAGRTP